MTKKQTQTKKTAKQQKKVTVADKLLNKEPVYQLNIFIQCIVLFLLMLFIIASIFVKEFSGTVKILLSLTLLSMTYNNWVIFKRKGLSVVYILTGIYFMVMAVLEAYGS